MALIQCPECANEVSDQAVSCPKCGFPIAAAPTSRTIQVNISRATDEDPVKQVLARDGKIAAIRFYRERTPGMGLAEAKNYVEALERGGGMSPATKSGCAGCFSVLVLAAILLFSLALVFLLAR